jgi:hypothetical protein
MPREHTIYPGADRAASHGDIFNFVDADGFAVSRFRLDMPPGKGRRAVFIALPLLNSVDAAPDSGNNVDTGQPVPRAKSLKAACGL